MQRLQRADGRKISEASRSSFKPVRYFAPAAPDDRTHMNYDVCIFQLYVQGRASSSNNDSAQLAADEPGFGLILKLTWLFK
jgi:hypothetical protein